jgi:hypothetical protein
MWRRMLAPAHDLPLALMVWPRLYRFDAHAATREIAHQFATLPLPSVRARAKRYFSLTAATGAARGQSKQQEYRGVPRVVRCASGGAPGALKGRRSLPRSPLW